LRQVSGKAVALRIDAYGRVKRRRRQSNEKANWGNPKEISGKAKVMAPTTTCCIDGLPKQRMIRDRGCLNDFWHAYHTLIQVSDVRGWSKDFSPWVEIVRSDESCAQTSRLSRTVRRVTRRTSQMTMLKRPRVKGSATLPQSSKAGSQNGRNDDVPGNDHRQQFDPLTSQLLETRNYGRYLFVLVPKSHELTRMKHPWHTRVLTQSLPFGEFAVSLRWPHTHWSWFRESAREITKPTPLFRRLLMVLHLDLTNSSTFILHIQLDHAWNACCTDLTPGAGGSVTKAKRGQFADQIKLTLHDKNNDQKLEAKQYLDET